MKKNIGIILTIIVLLMSILFSVNKYKENTPLESVVIKESKIKKEKYAMYKENDNGEYVEYESETFPLDTHTLNIEKSKCIDNKGNIIEGILRNENNKVIVDSNKTSYCYLYFDVKEYVITYNGNGGTIAEERKVVARGESIGTLASASKGKDYFAGWYTDTNYQTKIEEDYVPTRNMTIYARFYEWIDLKLETRTQGYPSDTTFENTTKRTYNMNTYVIGISYSNYYTYYPNTTQFISNFNYNVSSIDITARSGYGVGFPVILSNGTYMLKFEVSDVITSICTGVVKYDTNSEFTYKMEHYYANNTHIFEFDIKASDSYEVITLGVESGPGTTLQNITFSNINLYKMN